MQFCWVEVFKCILWKTTAKHQVYRFTSIIAYIDLKILICRLVRNCYQYAYKRLVYFNFMPNDSLMWKMNLSLPHLRTIPTKFNLARVKREQQDSVPPYLNQKSAGSTLHCFFYYVLLCLSIHQFAVVFEELQNPDK